MKIKFRNHHLMSALKWVIILVLLDAIAILFHFIYALFGVLRLENCVCLAALRMTTQ